ncbi:putative tyrosine-protein phosphatase non-receptor type 13 [Apostichopus japonicus]|uniref:Putative tyrosine-protein phosphatase non-receptor type 13 n=1 Tax=Stichopus japonicus TaxID=307972 RepID=A0A2G8LNT8_STIJA|nr:putative tyrosine-protein phosphatase non-receptor type 13 [Apostichopus japonicus]
MQRRGILAACVLGVTVEMGEYDPERMSQNYFLPEHYVPAGTIESMGVSAIRRKLPILHEAHEDMGDEEAEFEFLLEARKLSEYGIHFHKVSKSKKSSKQAVWLGICARGIIVYDKSGITRCNFTHILADDEESSFSRLESCLLQTITLKKGGQTMQNGIVYSSVTDVPNVRNDFDMNTDLKRIVQL